MLGTLKLVSIFLASPSDVAAEREIVKQVCDEIVLDLGRIHKFTIDLRRWETHAVPGIDESAQQVINSKIGKDYSIFIGIFGQRFGTPTLKWRSGTEEEFRIAHSNYTASGQPKIMLYFSSAPIDSYKLDIEQFKNLKDFQSEIVKLGVLYWTFFDASEFKISLRRHLINEILELLSGSLETAETLDDSGIDSSEPLPNLKMLQESDSLVRAHSLMRFGIKSMKGVEEDTGKITKSMVKLGQETAHFTRELVRINRTGSFKAEKLIREANRFFEAIDQYVDNLSMVVPGLRENFENGISDQYRAITILKAIETPDEASLGAFTTAIGSLSETLGQVHFGVENLNSAIVVQPEFGVQYEIRRKLLVAVNSDLLAFLSWARQALQQFQSDVSTAGGSSEVLQ